MRFTQRSSSADINDRRNLRVHRLFERATGRPPSRARLNVSDISGPVEVLVPASEPPTLSTAYRGSSSQSSSLSSRISRAFSISDRRTAATLPTAHARSHSHSASVVMTLANDFATLSQPLSPGAASNWSYEDVANARHGYVPSSASTSATATPTSAAFDHSRIRHQHAYSVNHHVHGYGARSHSALPFGSQSARSSGRPSTAPSSASPSPPSKSGSPQPPLAGSSLFRETFSRLSAVANAGHSGDKAASSSALRSRHISLPVSATLSQPGTPQPPSLARRQPFVMQDNSLDTPSRPGFRSKREAICLSPLSVTPVSPLSPSFMRPPETPSSVNSSASSRFRIPRKPVPALTPEDLGTATPPPTPKMCTDTSAGETSSSTSSSGSKPSSPATSTEAVDLPHIDLTKPNLSPNGSFSYEMDQLFDELLEECRTPVASRAPSTATNHPVMPEHRPVTPGRPLAHKTSSILRRTPAVRRSLRNLHKRSQSHPLPQSPKVVAPATPRGEIRHTRENSTPLPSCASPFKPFIPSQRSFEPLRATRSNSTPMLATTSTNIPTPAGRSTHFPAHTGHSRVKDRIQQIERAENSPMSSAPATPVKTLGAILSKNIRVSSDELTLESKRLMEEARARRAIR
ncbi:hypothetical protein Q8F55_004000 [Vanrija albida]|uniref:Uncharacterized protein n=1 Tax=Vanrija albida TaxID=181172 RepID=A0ABR3Q5S5_9TREE